MERAHRHAPRGLAHHSTRGIGRYAQAADFVPRQIRRREEGRLDSLALSARQVATYHEVSRRSSEGGCGEWLAIHSLSARTQIAFVFHGHQFRYG